MKISNNYIVVEKLDEEIKDGFKTVDVQDNFVYKGKVIDSGTQPLLVGDVVLFAKYSPDIHEIDLDGKKVKFVKIDDILAVL